ncbi:uncharacterized protein LOC107030129 [Solanum pennellii]|uniref:Uncharacterized protein LOC107030129 n=1 Tax=Solanum pennellii TaxID=28526 RepID=A0ABM1HKZ4_SOLPN|nr:uncharacterized protein LOC107030129 [Solanum pennellii]
MPQTNITHLPSVGSDHCPLLMEINDKKNAVIKYFKFLNCWTDNEPFFKTVEQCWQRKVIGSPMWCLHIKMKRLTKTLREWSKLEYGDIFDKVKQYEEEVKNAEGKHIMDNSKANREQLSASNANYIKYMKLEYSILQQKTQLQWLKKGDANTKYFHDVIRGRRKKMFIHKVMTDSGVCIHGEENIARAACEYYQNMFTGKTDKIREEMLQCIPNMVTNEQNIELEKMPSVDELRKVVMSMNPNSAPGPDGIGGKFFQVCFDIIKEDLLAAVKDFFNGCDMPKYMSHANIIMLPKVDHPNMF